MFQEQGRVPVIDWASVAGKLSKYETLYQVNDRNKVQYENANTRLNELRATRDRIRTTINRCTEIYKDVQKNLDEKKRFSLQEFQEAIEEAGNVVTDSDMYGITLKVDGDRAFLCNPKGHDVNMREGSAQRSVLGQMMRYVAMAQQLNVLPLILLDESFFTLSENTSIVMQDYLAEMSKHFLIIGVEQKDTLFSGIEDKRKFMFTKGTNGKSVIREV